MARWAEKEKRIYMEKTSEKFSKFLPRKNVDIKLRINLRKKQFHDICTVVYITGYMYHKSLKSVKKQQQLEKYYIFLYKKIKVVTF